MKKLVLRKSSYDDSKKYIGYRINYEQELNTAQYEAVMHGEGAALVIAGAGTGKTRTLVYRVARLIEDGVSPESILLLTFTRKAAAEMLRRASALLDGRCENVSGGTFHSFALNILRFYANSIGLDQSFNILDQSDAEDTINLIRNNMRFDKSKKRFPKKETLNDILSMSINTRTEVEIIIEKDYNHYLDFLPDIMKIFDHYKAYKLKHNLVDYDDLLSFLLKLMKENQEARSQINARYKYVMCDEYQDTNRLQHEIILSLAGAKESVMAVGDDAQSIYSFRGADYQNILFFPESFANCKVYKIEENYRSTQPILDFTNFIIAQSPFRYDKTLFTRRTDGELPRIVSAQYERHQSEFVCQSILDLREEGYSLEDIAVLFRSGFHSFDLEIELNKANIPYLKFGGLKFIETAHIKDIVAFLKILANSRDAVSWHRVLLLLERVGPRTAAKFIDNIAMSDVLDSGRMEPAILNSYSPSVKELVALLRELRNSKAGISDIATRAAEFYKPLLKTKHDDWQKRWRDIETLISITERYRNLTDFLNEIAIEPPTESVAELTPESKEEEFLTLSTIHSAKGLEWRAVIVIWVLEGRFPSAKAMESDESLEEERRLLYVAATRAKDKLSLVYPINIFDGYSGAVLSETSRFIREVKEDIADWFILMNEEDSELNVN